MPGSAIPTYFFESFFWIDGSWREQEKEKEKAAKEKAAKAAREAARAEARAEEMARYAATLGLRVLCLAHHWNAATTKHTPESQK